MKSLAVQRWKLAVDRTPIQHSTETAMHVLLGHQDFVNSVAFSPDGKTLASGGGDGVVRLWEISRSH